MKIKRIVIIIITILFVFLLNSCKDLGIIRFEQYNYQIEFKSNITLNPILIEGATNLEYTVNDSQIIKIVDNVVYAVGYGNTEVTVQCTYNEKVYKKVLFFNVIPPVLNIENSEENILLYNELEKKINEYKQNITEYEKFNRKVETKINFLLEKENVYDINHNKDFTYVDMVVDENRSIYTVEDSKVFNYEINDLITKKYLGNSLEYSIYNELPGNGDIIDTLDPSYTLVFKKEDNVYGCKVLLKNLIGDIDIDSIQFLGEYGDIILNSIVEFEFGIFVNEYYFTANLVIDYYVSASDSWEQLYYYIYSHTVPTDFEEFIFPKESKYYTKPTCFEEIIESTNMLSEVIVEANSTEIYKTSLEEGYYLVNLDQENASLITLEVYDYNNNLVKTKLGIGDSLDIEYQKLIYIPKSDDYYIKITNASIDNKYSISLKKEDLTINKTNVLESEEYIGQINSMYDYDLYVFNNYSNESSLLSLTNTSNNNIYILSTDITENNSINCIKPNEEYIIKVNPGNNNIYILSDFQDNINYEYSFTLSLENIYFDGYVINHDFSDPLVFEGDVYVKTYLTKGQYVFIDQDNKVSLAIDVYNENGLIENNNFDVEKIQDYDYPIGNYINIPEDGNYYLAISKIIKTNINIYHISCFILDYETAPNINNPKELSSNNEFILEGSWDFEYFTYNNSSPFVAVVKNNSTSRIHFISNGYSVSWGEPTYHIFLESEEEIVIYFDKPTANILFFYSLTNELYKKNKSYSISFEIHEFINVELDEVKVNEKVYICNESSSVKFSLTIDEQKWYYFEYDTYNSSRTYFKVFRKGGTQIGMVTPGKSLNLRPGEYEVELVDENFIIMGNIEIHN